MSVLKKIQNRRNFAVEVDGETVRLQSLSFDDGLQLHSLEDTHSKLFFALGCALLEDDGTRAIPREPDETPQQFSDRVRELTQDMRGDVMTALHEAIAKITKPPAPETLIKNSEPTDTPAS